MIKVLMISGSLRKESYNSALLKHFETKEGFSFYDKLGDLPLFNADLDQHDLTQDNAPHSVKEFRKALKEVDAIMISTPEYAHQIPGVLKNALDWVVSSGSFVGKPVMVISATPTHLGGKKAHEQLVYLLDLIDAKVIHKASMQIDKVNHKLHDDAFISDLENHVADFIATFTVPINR